MKQREILEVKPCYKPDGHTLDRTNSLLLDTLELIPEKRKKPKPEVIEQLRFIKKVRRENRFYPPEENQNRCIEYSVGELADRKYRRKKREQQINNIVGLLKQLQNDRHILSFSREFINDILKSYSKLSERCRQLILKEILKRGKEREIIKTEKRLKDIPHYEHKILGEKTKSKNYGLNREWVLINRYIKTYSFNN